jgi:hypothetical protein
MKSPMLLVTLALLAGGLPKAALADETALLSQIPVGSMVVFPVTAVFNADTTSYDFDWSNDDTFRCSLFFNSANVDRTFKGTLSIQLLDIAAGDTTNISNAVDSDGNAASTSYLLETAQGHPYQLDAKSVDVQLECFGDANITVATFEDYVTNVLNGTVTLTPPIAF